MSEDDTPSSAKQVKLDPVAIAESAVAEHPHSAIEVALAWCRQVVPDFISQDNDRLLKVGRSLRSLLVLREEIPLPESLALLKEECRLLLSPSLLKVPKVRFGKTELSMPIVTLGCMRFQQKWGTDIVHMDQVYSDCQDNLVAILRRAIVDFGMNHIETAWGYGSSQLQLGVALKQLFWTGQVRREDLILQTKVGPREDPKEFRTMLDESFQRLQVDYLDLFAFHGLNGDWQWEWMFGDRPQGNCWQVVQEYRARGKIRHIGFSTHGPTDLIYRLIETEKFDYVNLHHHFCGSYTASGDGGSNGIANLKCLRLMKKLDMGAFIISPFDKGGKVYAPSRKLRSLTLPDLEPMSYALGYLWNLEHTDPDGAAVHTLTIGAARPADLDQCAVTAYLQRNGTLLPKVKTVAGRLHQAQVDALGEDWIMSCYRGTTKSIRSPHMVEHNQVIWLYNCLKAWGMYEFAKERYKTLVNNRKNYDPTRTMDQNLDQIGRISWGFMPGLNPLPDRDYFVDDLKDVPECNRARYREAYAFVAHWCTPKDETKKDDAVSEEKEGPSLSVPKEWETSFEMKPWKDFPDRPYP